MMVIGLLFTFVSLLTVSGKTKRVEEHSLATTLNSPMLEDEQDSGEKVNDHILESGAAKSAEDMHVFPITSATIFF